MFLIFWLSFLTTAPAYAQHNALSSEEKLIALSELKEVFFIAEGSIRAKLSKIANNPKYKCSEKCKAAMAENRRQLELQMPTFSAALKGALAADLKKEFDQPALETLLVVYESTLFKRLRKSLPPPQINKKRIYPSIAQPINLETITSPDMQNTFNKEQLEWLKNAVTQPAFIKFNKYLLESKWTAIIDEKRIPFVENIKNPYLD